MVVQVSNYNIELDAHGQAAILLLRSLMHVLFARSVIDVADAVEIVDVAAEVKVGIAAGLNEACATVNRPLTILKLFGDSMRSDLADGTTAGAPQA